MFLNGGEVPRGRGRGRGAPVRGMRPPGPPGSALLATPPGGR